MTFATYTPPLPHRQHNHPVAELLSLEASSLTDLSDRTRQGFPRRSLERIGEILGLPQQQLAPLLGVNVRTLQRAGATLSPALSDHLFRIANLLDAAIRFHGSREAAVRWLDTPNPALGHAKPLECARTEAGNQAVLDLLGGLEHGVIQ